MKTTDGPYASLIRRPMLRFKCTDCGAAPWSQCRSKAGQDVPLPHKARVRAHLAKTKTDAQAVSCATT